MNICKKQLAAFVMAGIMVLATGITVLASSETKIDKVKVTFSYDKAPENGDAIGEIHASADSDEYTIDHAEYTNDTDTWTIGQKPLVLVELSAKSGYRFSYSSKSHFSLSGCNAVFKKAKINDNGASMELYVTLKAVGGKPDEVYGLEWSDMDATWDEMDGIKRYEVRLYRDDKLLTTVKSSKSYYDFGNKITKRGYYSFRVRAIAEYNDKAGEWSDYSEEMYFNSDDIRAYSRSSSTNDWVHNQYGWWYSYSNGSYPYSCWKYIDNAWYYFNADGYMLTGWQLINNGWYYMNSSGVMLTGWQYINNGWYYLNSSGLMLTDWQYINDKWYYLNSSGLMLTGWQNINNGWYYLDSSGAMLTGWQYIDNRWYYLNSSGLRLTDWQYINDKWYYLDSSGAMYANSMTPDGHYVDGNGVLVY